MRLQIASDLHLESRPKQTFRELLEPGAAPLLALLGDVAPLSHPNLRPFLEWCSEHWETVLWIPGCVELLGPGSGNDRPGGSSAPDFLLPVERMKRLAEPFWNITVLDHDGMVSSDGVYVFGLPFWKFPNEEGYIWDPRYYRYVESEPSPADPAVIRRAYNESLAWVQARASAQKEPVVILSHFGPTTWIQEEGFVGDPDRCVVFNDVERLLRPPIVAWLCGHCHHSTLVQKEWSDADGSKGTVLIATNPKGLPFENLEYRRDAVIRIDPQLYGIR